MVIRTADIYVSSDVVVLYAERKKEKTIITNHVLTIKNNVIVILVLYLYPRRP